jgi:acyl-CoA synthetase (AMP-forming)/AMP-acid ligase II
VTSFAYRSLADALAIQAETRGDKVAFIYLADGDCDEQALTFAELHEAGLGLASRLRISSCRGNRALILLPPGLDYVTAIHGCLYAGIIGVSAPPPQHRRGQAAMNRLLGIGSDADVSTVLTTSSLLDVARAAVPREHPLLAAEWIAVDELPPTSDSSLIVCPDLEDVALVQYTSGSTTEPRGVQLTHGNLLDNSRFIADRFGHDGDASIGFNWIPPFHDMGLIGAILQPAICGGMSVLASPLEIVKRPYLWLKGIDRFRATTSGGPNFFYDLCVDKVRDEDCAGLDLSCWKVAFNGAEPVRADTMRRFSEKFKPFGFRFDSFFPCYGLAEATLMVTAPTREDLPNLQSFSAESLAGQRPLPGDGRGSVTLAGCGTSNDRHRVRIVNPETHSPTGHAEIGEIWVSGPSVAPGYRGEVEDNEHVFQARLRGSNDAAPYLRTGDLGFLYQGDLFVVGRLRDLIVIRGRNHHPQDIETAAERGTPLLAPHASAVFQLCDGKQPEVALVAEAKRADPEEAREAITAIRGRVAQHLELPLTTIVLCPKGTVPKTTSGKIQRSLCRSLLLAGKLETIAEWRLLHPSHTPRSE